MRSNICSLPGLVLVWGQGGRASPASRWRPSTGVAGQCFAAWGSPAGVQEGRRLEPPSPHLVFHGPGTKSGISGFDCAGSQLEHTGSFSCGMQDLDP